MIYCRQLPSVFYQSPLWIFLTAVGMSTCLWLITCLVLCTKIALRKNKSRLLCQQPLPIILACFSLYSSEIHGIGMGKRPSTRTKIIYTYNHNGQQKSCGYNKLFACKKVVSKCSCIVPSNMRQGNVHIYSQSKPPCYC